MKEINNCLNARPKVIGSFFFYSNLRVKVPAGLIVRRFILL